jgi:hypothetical protein
MESAIAIRGFRSLEYLVFISDFSLPLPLLNYKQPLHPAKVVL